MKGLGMMRAMAAKGDEPKADASASPKPKGAEDAALGLAWEAMQDKDEASFKRAMRAAIRACVQEYGSTTKE